MSAVLKLLGTRLALAYARWAGHGVCSRLRSAELALARRQGQERRNLGRRAQLSESFMDQAKELSRKTP